MKIRAVGGVVALVLREDLEQKLRLEGEVDIGGGKKLFLAREQKGDTLPQMRVGTILSVGGGIWKKVDGEDRHYPMPKSILPGMTVCLPPFNLVERDIPGIGKVVFTNPHSLMGVVTENEPGSNSGTMRDLGSEFCGQGE